jgi:hypothetical protein
MLASRALLADVFIVYLISLLRRYLDNSVLLSENVIILNSDEDGDARYVCS